MAYVDKRLAKFAKQSGKFIKMDVGDSMKLVYISYKFVEDEKYKKMKPVYVFKTEEGVQKELSTSSKKFAKKMMVVVPGSLVQVTKLDEGQKTDYAVKVLKQGKMTAINDPEDEEDDDDDELEGLDVEEAPKKKKKVVEEEDDEDEDEEDDEDDEPVVLKKKKKKVVEDDDDASLF